MLSGREKIILVPCSAYQKSNYHDKCIYVVYGVLYHPAAAVRNLRVRSDPKEPSVTLAWDPPLGSCDIISSYEVHFQNCSGGHVYMTGVDRYTTSVCISKEMGLEPLRRCVFKVRAKDLDEVPGEWSEVSKFVGR